jgi:hypothetical protein
MRIQGMFRVLLVLLLLAVASQVTFAAVPHGENNIDSLPAAATYYVANAPFGDDSHPGTESEPWEHCPGMPGWTGSATLEPGDTVYFDSGGTWETASGSALLQVVGGVTYDGSTWGSGTRATFRATGNLSLSVINFMDDDTTYPTVVRGFEADAGGHQTTGIGMNWPTASHSLTGAMKRIEDCIIHDTYSRSAEGSYEYGIVVGSGYNPAGNMHVSNVEVLDCEVYNISRGGINIYAPNDHPTSSISNVLVRGNEVYATGQDPSYAGSAIAAKNHVINVTFEYNITHDLVRGPSFGVSTHNESFTGPENLIVRYNIISGSANHVGFYIQSPGDKDMEIYGNIIMNNVYGGMVFAGSLDDSFSALVYNNIFYYNCQESWCYEVRIHDNPATIAALEIRNNIFFPTAHISNLRCIGDDEGNITLHSNNLFYYANGGNIVYDTGVGYTAATLNTWEPTAQTDNPAFVNTGNLPTGFTGTYGIDLRPNTDGLNLTVDSPARDAGAALGASYDSSINSVTRPQGTGWDIGAYEFVPDLDLRGAPGNQTIYLDWQVSVDPSPTSTWRISYYTDTSASTVVVTDSLTYTARAYTLTGLTNYQWYTVTLNAMVDSSPVLTDTVRVMPTDVFVRLPLMMKED